MLTLDFDAMGCRARAVVAADGPEATASLAALPEWFARRARSLSRFDRTSALSQLNARGEIEQADELLWAAVGVALRAARDTDGLVTPTVLSALVAAGYDRSFDDMQPDQGAPAVAADVPAWTEIVRDAARRSVRLPRGAKLDLGGTAKGWSVDQAAATLDRFGPVLVDVGGDIATSRRASEPWPIGVADPRGGEEPLDVLLLEQGGVATSGRDVRRWTRGGIAQHHVIDPRTGAPARTDVLTVTVVAPHALDAEIAAKRVLLEGSAAGLAWLETSPELAALVVLESGTVLRSRRFARHTWRSAA